MPCAGTGIFTSVEGLAFGLFHCGSGLTAWLYALYPRCQTFSGGAGAACQTALLAARSDGGRGEAQQSLLSAAEMGHAQLTEHDFRLFPELLLRFPGNPSRATLSGRVFAAFSA